MESEKMIIAISTVIVLVSVLITYNSKNSHVNLTF